MLATVCRATRHAFTPSKLWLHEWLCPDGEKVGDGESNKINNKDTTESAAGTGKEKDCTESSNVDETIGDGMEDVYAIGFQELVDLNAVNVAIDIRSQASRTWNRDDVFRRTQSHCIVLTKNSKR